MAAIALGLAAFISLYGWQQCESGRPTAEIGPLYDVIALVQRGENTELVREILGVALHAEANGVLSSDALVRMDGAVRRSAADGEFSDSEVIQLASILAEGTSGVPIGSMAEVRQMLARP